MQAIRIFALASLAVVVFDAIASIASLVLGFPYSSAVFGSAVLYIAFAFFTARKLGFWPAVLLGAAMGVTDATAGWAVSWIIGPGRLPVGVLTLPVWLYTAAFVVTIGTICGFVGGGIGVLTKHRRAG